MNWSKAKTILIITFVITDIFLLFIFFKPGAASAEFKDTAQLTEFLSARGIYVDAEQIPGKHKDLPVLYVHSQREYSAIDKLIEDKSRWKVEGKNDEDYKKMADAFIKEAGSVYSSAKFSGIERDEGLVKVIYISEVNKITVETSRIVCIFKDGELSDFDCNWLEVIEFHDKPQKTISAAQALLLFMAITSDDKEEIYIEDIEMVYWLDESVEIELPVSEDTAFPVWKITYNGGEFKHIDAFEHS